MNVRHDFTTENTTSELTGNETITQLARRHFKDKSHVTTDEELRNAKIELTEIVTADTKNLYTKKSIHI